MCQVPAPLPFPRNRQRISRTHASNWMSVEPAVVSKGGMGPATCAAGSGGGGRQRRVHHRRRCSWQMAALCVAGPVSFLLIFLFHPAFSSGLSPFMSGRGAAVDGGAQLAAAGQPGLGGALPDQQPAARLVLRYTACAGLMNQHYSHIAAFALAAALGASWCWPLPSAETPSQGGLGE